MFVTLCQYEQNSVRVLSDVLMRYWVYGQRELILAPLEGVWGHSSEVTVSGILEYPARIDRGRVYLTCLQ